MSSSIVDLSPKAAYPPYTEWRGTILAELSLARVPSLVVNKEFKTADYRYDFLVTTGRGVSFFVEVKAFSSMRLDAKDVDASEAWSWKIDAQLVRRARESRSPFFLFVFDADTDHGRYLRLDTMPAPKGRTVAVRIPLENALDRAGVERLVAELEGSGE